MSTLPTTGRAGSAPLLRRTLLASGAAVGAIVLVSRAGRQVPGALPTLRPDPADALVDSFGIGIHLNFRSSVYGRHEEVIDWVERLGARHVRTRLTPVPDVMDAFEELARRGIGVQGTCGAFGDTQSMTAILGAVRRRFTRPGDVFDAFEGINEPNNDGVPWIEETRRKTSELHEARSGFALEEVPIVAPALARVTGGGVEGDSTLDQARNLGSLEQWVDVGNMHVYPRGRPPSGDIDYFLQCARVVAGPGAVMCTEGGYFTATDYVGPASPVPPDVAAAYGAQSLLEHWIAGTRRYFRYELLDEPDAGNHDREGTLGLVRTAGGQWQPKPEFTSVRRLLEVFSDPGHQRFDRRPLTMALRNHPEDLRSADFVKRDGTHVVALWLDRYLYDPVEQRRLVGDIRATLATVDVVLDDRREISVEHLLDGGVDRRHDEVSVQTVRLPAGVTVLQLK